MLRAQPTAGAQLTSRFWYRWYGTGGLAHS
jgi:hypothetical protein